MNSTDRETIEALVGRVEGMAAPDASDLVALLGLEDAEGRALLYARADAVRRECVGDGILVRGIVEFSSYCKNTCKYCGLNRDNVSLARYRLTEKEILDSVACVASAGIKTVVLQSGEDDDSDPALLASVVRQVKERFGMAVTLSVGERPPADYRLWREAGADRYLLKIETTDRALYESLHPDMSFDNRLRCLHDLRALGYQVGSGILVGLKGQTAESLAQDLLFFKEQDFDMIGIGPFIPHACTGLAGENPGDAAMTLKMLALTRILTRTSHLPATTALGSLNGHDFRIEGLTAGANVLMPNFTPQPYKKLYEIYPGKRCVSEGQGSCAAGCLARMAASIGRRLDYSVGHTLKSRSFPPL